MTVLNDGMPCLAIITFGGGPEGGYVWRHNSWQTWRRSCSEPVSFGEMHRTITYKVEDGIAYVKRTYELEEVDVKLFEAELSPEMRAELTNDSEQGAILPNLCPCCS